ncbi:hypothetical protein HYX12_04970 [Candidatus Woesearchaeota archaeon]|nr:hypothetical protein [Candidatus Woesearchaeota archaeon]
MEYTHILLREGELFLKGKNVPFFENILISNLRRVLPNIAIQRSRGRIILPYFPEHHNLVKIFGLVSYSPCTSIKKDLEEIKQRSLEIIKYYYTISPKKDSFRIETKRSDKTFPFPSPQINQLVGKFIEESSSLKFQAVNPDLILHIEINREGAYIFTEIIPCFGGIPVGVEGKVFLLLREENFSKLQPSLLSAILMMKRGCKVIPIYLTDEHNAETIASPTKTNFDLFKRTLDYFSPTPVDITLVGSIGELESLSTRQRIDVIVVGDNLENYQKIDCSLITLRPLIAYSSQGIQEKLNFFMSSN